MSGDNSNGTFSFKPIGTFYGGATYKYEAPRQGIFNGGRSGRIELNPHCGFEEALRDIGGFERLWILFVFHQNRGWRATTRPPVPHPDHERVGIFASRGPYRPNPIGLSCVRLVSVEKLSLTVEEADLLNGTPVLDIKPYIPAADAFPHAAAGWVDLQVPGLWKVEADEAFLAQSVWLEKACGLNLLQFAECQLSANPFDASRKRVRMLGENIAELAFRTFRIDFSFDENLYRILLLKIRSGYTPEELDASEDRYGDKDVHREFSRHFAQSPNA